MGAQEQAEAKTKASLQRQWGRHSFPRTFGSPRAIDSKVHGFTAESFGLERQGSRIGHNPGDVGRHTWVSRYDVEARGACPCFGEWMTRILFRYCLILFIGKCRISKQAMRLVHALFVQVQWVDEPYLWEVYSGQTEIFVARRWVFLLFFKEMPHCYSIVSIIRSSKDVPHPPPTCVSVLAPVPNAPSQRALDKRPLEDPQVPHPKHSWTISELEGLISKRNSLLWDLQKKMLELGSQAVLVGEWQEEVTWE